MTATQTSTIVVAGFGSEYRLDDGVGPMVASKVAESSERFDDVGPMSDPLDLLGRWNNAELAVVVDATRSGLPPGSIRVIDVDVSLDDMVRLSHDDPTPSVTSTHGVGLEGVLRLARAIHQGPRRLVVVGVEGECFGFGVGLSPSVSRAVPEAVRRVLDLVENGN